MLCPLLLRPAARTLLALSAALAWAIACSRPPPRTANPTRPLDERRAIEIIADEFRRERTAPAPGKDVALSRSSKLHVDVGAQGKRFGVAYVTAVERRDLGPTLPARDPAMGDALQLISGAGDDGDARILVLHDSDYLYDDHIGETREKSTVTAELKLRRDVRDFLVRAQSEKWP